MSRANSLGAWASTLWMNIRLNKTSIAGVFVLAVVGLCLFIGWLAISGPTHRLNWGFGPDWDCADSGKASALVCIKNIPKKGN